MLTKLAGVSVAGFVIAALGDAATAAAIAGVFTLVNTALLAWLHKRTSDVRADQVQMREALTSPRRIIYDQDGNPIGTVLDLHRTGGWDEWMTQHGRRAGDQSEGEPPPA